MAKAKKVSPLDVDRHALAAVLERVKDLIADDDYVLLAALAATVLQIDALLRSSRATIARLRRLFGLARSEKTADVKAKAAAAGTPGEKADAAAPAAPGEKADAAAPAAPGEKADAAAPAAGTCAPAPAEDAVGGKPDKRKGHGRLAASAYTEAEHIPVPHPSLRVRDLCPTCKHGHLYDFRTVPILRIHGQPPLGATCWDCECLRCGACGTTFTAKAPAEAQGEKVDDTAAAMIAAVHCGAGMPFHRLEQLQGNLGIPLPASTQWHAIDKRVPLVQPVFDEFRRQAAQAELLFADDSYMRILSFMGKRRAKLVEQDLLPNPDRTGLYTTAILASVAQVGTVALFVTGRQYAGENVDDLLDGRDKRLPPPLFMSDALNRNLPTRHQVVWTNCIAHGRRKIVDESANFPAESVYLLERLALVYKVDNECKMQGLSDAERLRVHQEKSGPVLEDLHAWMTAQLDDKRVEDNSGLGKAFHYFLKRWEKFTVFLRRPGAPLDNNIAERALKMAIKLRNASLFYKTEHGAKVGDIYMSLIHTAELHRQNPVHYLTALFRHHKEVAAAPAEWLPWNYKLALATLRARDAAAANHAAAPLTPPSRSATPTATGPRRPSIRGCRPRAAPALRVRAAAERAGPSRYPAASVEIVRPKAVFDTAKSPGHRTQEA